MRRYFKQIVIIGPRSRDIEDFAKDLRMYFGKHNNGNVKVLEVDQSWVEIWLEIYSPRRRALLCRELLAVIKRPNPSFVLLRRVFWSTWRRRFGRAT